MNHSSKSGLSLVGAMLAVALFGIIMSTTTKVIANSFKQYKSYKTHSDLDDIRRFIGSKISCEKTISAMPKSCSDRDVISVKSTGKKDLKVRHNIFELTAVCTGDEEFKIFVRSKNKTSSEWFDLYEKSISPCFMETQG